MKQLTSLEKSYNEELKHLRNLVLNIKEEQSNVSHENLKELQNTIEQEISSLKENIFSLDGL